MYPLACVGVYSVPQLCTALCDPIRLLCPQDFPGKHSGLTCHFLLQGIFQTWVSNPHLLCLLLCRQIFLPRCRLGSPLYSHHVYYFIHTYSHPIHLSIKVCDVVYLTFHFISFIHIVFQLAVCVQYYNVVHKKLVHLF